MQSNSTRRPKINHGVLFLLGFIYYLIVPPLIGTFEFISDYPGMPNWIADFSDINWSKIMMYCIIVLTYLISFFAGSLFINLVQKRVVYQPQPTRKHLNISGYTIPIFILIVFIAVINREYLFTGYSEQSAEFSVLGPLTTLTMVQTYIVIYQHISNLAKGKLYLLSLITLIFASIILMGLGSRMYVLIPILASIIFKINYSEDRTSLTKFFFLGIGILLAMLAVGAWRIGVSFDPGFYLYLFFAEPTFTWWSASTFLSNNDLSAFSFPVSFGSSIINFIPSIFFENKSDYIINLNTIYNYRAPLGAESLFVSVQGNFGYVYGFCYIFLIGFYYSLIRVLSVRNVFYKTYYVLICAVLPFQFFRDPFSVINKQIFWNMFLIPMMLYTIAFFLRRLIKSYYITCLRASKKLC